MDNCQKDRLPESMIHVYPGMGATASMYGERWREAIAGTYHNWPEWSGEETIAEMAATLIEAHGISDGDTVIGSSLGGMLAAEVSRTIELERIILIGSAIHPDEIRTLLKVLHPIIDYTPLDFIQKLAGKVPMELSGMFAETDPGYIRAMCKAVFLWEGIEAGSSILRIHGKHDSVIPPPSDAHLIDGGHLIAMTHAEECLQMIQQL